MERWIGILEIFEGRSKDEKRMKEEKERGKWRNGEDGGDKIEEKWKMEIGK